MQPNTKFNLSQVLRLQPSSRLHRYLQLTDKHKDSQSWRQISLHILSKQDPSNQYTILKQILSRMKNSDRRLFSRIAPKIDRQFHKCHTMGSVLVLVKYILAIQNKDCDYFAEQGYKQGLRKFGLFQRDVENMEGITFIDNQNPIFAEIESAVEVIPRLYNRLKLPFEIGMLKPFILWLTLYRCKNYEYCVILDEFCKFLVIASASANKLMAGYDIEGTATLISEVLNKCLLNYPNSHNMCLIFQNMSELEVETAVVRYQKLFSKYSSADMVKFSNVLTKGSLGIKTIRLFFALSVVLKNMRMNDKLVDYFKNFIIPKILLWGKTSETCENEIKSLIDFYVNGLLDRTPNREQCISNILTDFNRLGGLSQEYWTKVMYKIAYGDYNLISKIQRECKGIAYALTKPEFDKLELVSWRIMNSSSINTASTVITSAIQQHLPPTNTQYKPHQSIHRPPIRPFYQQQSPVSEKKIQPPKPYEQQTHQPYISKQSGDRITHSTILPSQNNRQSHLTSTPQLSKYGTAERFNTRSPADNNRVVTQTDHKLTKTVSTRSGTENTTSSFNSRVQPTVQKYKEPKVTPTKTFLIPAKSVGYPTNYADMTIMLLFALEKFPLLLEEIKDQFQDADTKYPLLKELNFIFSKLSNFEGKQITMANIMKLGPKQYIDQQKQFQITEYMTKLFKVILSDFQRISGRYNTTEKFKQLFQIVIKQQGVCPQCRNQITEFVNTYFLQVPSHEHVRTQWQSQKDIKCQKCRKTTPNVPFKNKIISSPTFTLVHLINQNKRRESLPRRWNNSNLVAVVIINSMSSYTVGEYRFYVRSMKNPMVWNQWTPGYPQTLEFTNEEEDDEFEGKFMSYLAVYQQSQ